MVNDSITVASETTISTDIVESGPRTTTSKMQRTKLYGIVAMVQNLVTTRQFDELDEIYGAIDIDNTSVLELISYIRTAYPHRNNLRKWRVLVKNAHNKAVDQYSKTRANQIFVGLL